MMGQQNIMKKQE